MAELNISRSTVFSDLAWIQDALREQVTEMADLDRAVHLKRLEENFQKARASFEASKAPEVRTTTKDQAPRPDGTPRPPLLTTVVIPKDAGDPRFLREEREAIVKHLELTIGYPAVKLLADSQKNQEAWQQVIEEELDAEELKMLERIHAKVVARVKGETREAIDMGVELEDEL